MLRNYQNIRRRKSKKIKVGSLSVGGDSPISVQSMTNTLTLNTKDTIDYLSSIGLLRIPRIVLVTANTRETFIPLDVIRGLRIRPKCPR